MRRPIPFGRWLNLNLHFFQRRSLLLWIVAFVAAASPRAYADLGIAVADPTTIGTSMWTHAGHSLVYLSNVCAETPVRARLCRPGEQGSILTAYPHLRENRPFHWNIVPLNLYLNGLEDPGNRLLFASRFSRTALETWSRERTFRTVCTDGSCPDLPHSYWRDLIASTIDRDIFIYAVHTTPEQDQAAVDWLNRDPNIENYNYLTNNCADFTHAFVNAIFPHAVHRDVLNDLGMMGPKAAARSFTHWALKHPELGFYSVHYAQIPSEFPRATPARSGTEAAIHTKKYLIPVALIGDHEVAGSFFVAYFLTGRFSLYKAYTNRPAPDLQPIDDSGQALAGHDAIVGSSAEWTAYRKRFAVIAASPEARELTTGHKHPFPPQYDAATAIVDRNGDPWLTFTENGSTRRVGISSRNLLASESDPTLAFQLMLGRVAYQLKAHNHLRESMQEFRADWALLEQARARLHGTAPATLTAANDPFGLAVGGQ